MSHGPRVSQVHALTALVMTMHCNWAWQVSCSIPAEAMTVVAAHELDTVLTGALQARACLPAMQVDGDWRYDARRSSMLWTIDLVDDQNRSGSMEFVVRLHAFRGTCRTHMYQHTGHPRITAVRNLSTSGSGAQRHIPPPTVAMQVPACDPGTFFPVECNFTATKTLCDIQVQIQLDTDELC
jgi:hypothetical protein